MKRICSIILSFGWLGIMAQSVDISEFSQNLALRDTSEISLSEDQMRVATYPFITETYQIPSYELYDRYWDVENLRSRVLEIPFANDRLMLLLVQASNNPFEVPCAFDAVVHKFGYNRKGEFHVGVDLSVEPQTLVKSCFDGVVRMAKNYGQYGLTVVVRHYNGLETVYAHLDKICVKPGQMVNAGNVIGQTGMTGNAKDYVLHFETRFMNEFFDPELIVDFDNETLIKNSLVLTPSDFKIISLEEVAKSSSVSPVTKPVVKPQPEVQPSVKESVTTGNNQMGPAENTSASSSSEPQYYVVKKGESLYRIAVNHNTTVDKIKALNNIENADVISEGQRLRVK